jgi:hypothetical protein
MTNFVSGEILQDPGNGWNPLFNFSVARTLVGAHFPDVAVSTSSTALTIWTSTDGENGSHAQMSFSRRS